MGKLGYHNVSQKRTVWREISEQYSGKFSIFQTKSNVLERFNLVIPYNEINIEITESDTRPLKLSFEAELHKKFEFSISQEDFTDKITKFFGKKELQIKDKEFNDLFFLKSNNDFLLIEFLDNPELIAQIKELNLYSMNCEFNKKTSFYHFLSVFSYNIKKKETLDEIIQLHFIIIQRLKSLMLIK